MLAKSTAPQRRGVTNACLAVGVFLAANFLRLLLLRGTSDQSLQVDYALIPLSYWITRHLRMRWSVQAIIGAFVAALVISGDMLDIMARRFNWSHGVVVDYAYSMPDFPWRIILPFVALGFATTALSIVPFAVRRSVFAIWPLVVTVSALLIANAIIYNGARGDVGTTRLTQSFVAHAALGSYNRLIIGRTLTAFPSGSMTRDLKLTSPPSQILSVAVESFGWARDPVQRAILLEPLLEKLGPYYTIMMSAHAFAGSTLPGEIRELCALQANGIPNTPKLLRRLQACLPEELRKRGYDTQALHGNGPLMYDRRVVYPAMGFARTWFNTDIWHAAPGIGPCPGTAFRGVCDAELLARALSLFDGHRRFVHVMTLDAHLPLPGTGQAHCAPAFQLDEGLCRYAQVTRSTFSSLAWEIQSARHRPDLIIIYGDHAPPFAATRAREQFSQSDVPYITLRRRPTGYGVPPASSN